MCGIYITLNITFMAPISKYTLTIYIFTCDSFIYFLSDKKRFPPFNVIFFYLLILISYNNNILVIFSHRTAFT